MSSVPGQRPRVHLLVGLNASGKTTYARQLSAQLPAVRFTLDEWMLRLHGLAYDDPRYPDLAEKCKDLIWDIAQQVLAAGVDVVLDWNQWSRSRRQEWAARAAELGYGSVLYYLRVPVETAIARALDRAAQGNTTAHNVDAAGVLHLQTLLEEPAADEGLELRIVTDPGAGLC